MVHRRPEGYLMRTLLALLALTACAPASAEVVDGARIYITDGDTIRLPNGDRVRLAGIDTAEMPPRAACDREVKLALDAKARLHALVRNADEVTLRRPPGERDADRYGRLLRDVLVDGQDVGAILVEEGLAQVWQGRKAEWCAKR
jgi:micrococcal nuclease